MKEKKVKTITNPCVVCGKTVKWGDNGCPLVNKADISVLLGKNEGFIHYDCMEKFKSKKTS